MSVCVYIYIHTHTYICITESLCCTEEIKHIIVNKLYFNKNKYIKGFKFQCKKKPKRKITFSPCASLNTLGNPVQN